MTGISQHFAVLSYVVAIGVTAGTITALKYVAPRLGLVDTPGGHHMHHVPTPLVGGIGMFSGFSLSVLILQTPLSTMLPLFAGCALLVVVGVLDDLHELSTRARFGAQIIAAFLVAVWGDLTLRDLGYLVSEDIVDLGMWAVPITVFATVGVVNALNMSDGMDGQAGGVVFIAFGFLVLVTMWVGREPDMTILVLIWLTTGAFLAFNIRLPGRRRAAVFMGDAGSMFLGFVLSYYLIDLSQGEDRVISPVTALWFLALPLYDTVGVMFRRILEGCSPFGSDRTHYHHLLLGLGLRVNQSLFVILTTATALASVGLAGQILKAPEPVMFYGFLGLFLVYFLITGLGVRRMRSAASLEPRLPS